MKTIKSIFILFVLISTITIISCKKEETKPDTRPDCEKNNWGTLKVDNYFADPYKVYVDDAYKGTVAAYGLETYTNISSGTHATKYIQASGYVLYPTEYTLAATITQCQALTAKLQ